MSQTGCILAWDPGGDHTAWCGGRRRARVWGDGMQDVGADGATCLASEVVVVASLVGQTCSTLAPNHLKQVEVLKLNGIGS